MMRLIDAISRRAVLEILNDLMDDDLYPIELDWIARDIKVLPTLDVVSVERLKEETDKRIATEKTSRQILENYVPVVHARWEHLGCRYMDGLAELRCTRCECVTAVVPLYENRYYYCPYCGARMDGDPGEEP